MDYIVRPGDSLWSLARTYLGDGKKWPLIARANAIEGPNRILVGQRLTIPSSSSLIPVASSRAQVEVSSYRSVSQDQRPALVPARGFLFVIADEAINSQKFVRKVVFPEAVQDAQLIRRILNPQKYGFTPRQPLSNVSLGRHVLGMTDSKFTSASEHPFGASRFGGKRYWIDVQKLQESGAVIHDGEAIARDLQRILDKTKPGTDFHNYIKNIMELSRADAEVVVEGPIPAGAVKGAGAMALTRTLQVVQVAGIVLTVYDLGAAGYESYQEGSVRPIGAEAIRQAGGWGGAWAGATAFAGVGALAGIETGPGALIIGAIGGVIGGIAGYYDADWIADYIHKN